MKSWLSPLGVFVVGQVLVLALSVFLPSIDTATAALNAQTVSISGFAWGWTWIMSNGVARFFFYMVCECAVLFATGMAFLASKH